LLDFSVTRASPTFGFVGRYSHELINLPTQPTTAERVLRVAADPRSDARGLAGVIETDIALTARLLRLANSPYHGVPRQVANVSSAVVLLGFQAVRALAVSSAYGLLDDEDDVQRGFWRHAVSSAAACSVVAERIGGSSADAFSAGLLHDLGAVLLHRSDADRFAATRTDQHSATSDVLARELREFGRTHTQVGAEAAEAWAFPKVFVEAISSHHGVDEPAHSLGRIVRAGEALALQIEYLPGHPQDDDLDHQLALVRLPESMIEELLERTREQIDHVAAVLQAAL
jgi:putative nucleotidyltransferase with HDIG domain